MLQFKAPFQILVVIIASVVINHNANSQEVPFVNWETAPIHPLDLSPDKTRLAVAHTADARVEIFSVTTGIPVSLMSIPVGLDPVSVRFRDNNEIWVVNHISDSVSVIDLNLGRVIQTLQTDDEPADVVFAGTAGNAYVSCSQANTVLMFNTSNLTAAPQRITIDAEEPKALAVSPDGQFVYAAIFESGNATTILGGGIDEPDILDFPPNVVNQASNPNAGVNPSPNAGSTFEPPINPALPAPPRVGLIVRRDAQGRWLDDNQTDWTGLVSGQQSASSGRPTGWDLPDRDIARINTTDLQVDYASGLMNIGMTLAVNPDNGALSLIGTDATNEIRFEPVINGTFVRVTMGTVAAGDFNNKTVSDLNSHLDYQSPRVNSIQRERSIGDPRGAAWDATGQHLYITGMGSNNLITVNDTGQRVGASTTIEVGEGPTGIVVDDDRQRLYVWNRFDKSISVVDTQTESLLEEVSVFDPTPVAIQQGRPFLYDTHLTSGLGQASCAACHVDSKMDRLAWDLGDPAGEMIDFQKNCITGLARACEDFHPMKGPMVTQTLQDIIGNEPFHWRGDRRGIEEFNPAFVGLMGRDNQISSEQMQRFEDFLATITFPPNPNRNIDNSLPTDLPLPGQFTTGRFTTAGMPLPNGNAVAGLSRYRSGLLDTPFQCVSCHTLPTGMGANSPLRTQGIAAGGVHIPTGPLGENNLGIVSVDGSTNISIKVPQLRNLYEKVGFDMTQTENSSGFGFLHDGSVDSLARFVNEPTFGLVSVQDTADMVAFMMAFSGSDLPLENLDIDNPGPPSKDSHAAVGKQVNLVTATNPLLDQLVSLADSGAVDLIADTPNESGRQGWVYDRASTLMQGDSNNATLSVAELRAQASSTTPQTWTVVPSGLGIRLGIDRNMDGLLNAEEPQQSLNGGFSGAWFDPEHNGEGLLIEIISDDLAVVYWFTYDNEGNQRWHVGIGPIVGNTLLLENLTAPTGGLFGENFDPESVERPESGSMAVRFNDCSSADLFHQVDGILNIQNLTRITSIAGLPCDNAETTTSLGISGSWFEPAHNGEGFIVEEIGNNQVIVYWFSYDEQGEQAWFFGAGTLDGRRLVIDETSITAGGIFGPQFDPDTVVVNPWGQLIFEFGCDQGSVDYSSSIPAYGNGSQSLTRLTILEGITCQL